MLSDFLYSFAVASLRVEIMAGMFDRRFVSSLMQQLTVVVLPELGPPVMTTYQFVRLSRSFVITRQYMLGLFAAKPNLKSNALICRISVYQDL